MNSVILVGRLTRDPELRYASGSQTAVANFTLAVDRPFSKNDEADFLRIVVFGKSAENCGTYLRKGSQVAVQGRIQTGSYETKTGERRYTTDIVADRVEFLGKPQGSGGGQQYGQYNQAPQQQQQAGSDYRDGGFGGQGGQGSSSSFDAIPDGFHAFDEEDDDNIPF